VFAVIHGTVRTAADHGGVLPGVVRARVLELCAERGLAATHEPITRSQLARAEEVFATSTLRGVVPVTQLDGERRPAGELTAQLAADYRERMRARR
jgi:D-alanine transaminase